MPVERRLYLVRHAIAAVRGPEWPDDAVRPLTPRGVRRFEQAVAGFDALGESIDLIVTSPLLRARQTAEILADGLSSRPRVRVLVAMSPGNTPMQMARALSGVPARTSGIAVVGHEPGLGALAAWCLGTRTPLAFKKGGMCRIDVDAWPPDADGRLIWFATPKMMRGR